MCSSAVAQVYPIYRPCTYLMVYLCIVGSSWQSPMGLQAATCLHMSMLENRGGAPSPRAHEFQTSPEGDPSLLQHLECRSVRLMEQLMLLLWTVCMRYLGPPPTSWVRMSPRV